MSLLLCVLLSQLILSNVVGIPGVVVASFAVDSKNFGRRAVMFLSTLLASLSFVVFLFAESEWQVVVASCVQNFVIQSSWAAVVTLTSETPPTSHRARVVGGANLIKAISGGFFLFYFFIGHVAE